MPASAAIPDSERATLLALYDSTNGVGWIDNSGWGDAAGTECKWYGIACNTGNHVIGIQLDSNNLVGTLPELSALTSLDYFRVGGNQLTGALPDLSGLSSLQVFYVDDNQLTGHIPDLSGLTSLVLFRVGGNQLTGHIPDLSGLTLLQSFIANYNDLTGTIPDVSDLPSLRFFIVQGNQLAGTIPDLSGLTMLEIIRLDDNQLTGHIPDLSGLTSLSTFRVDDKQLSGTPAAAPAGLWAGYSRLCPNFLHTPSPTDTAWDIATGETLWSQNCTPGYLVTPMAGRGGSITPALPHAVVSGVADTLMITPNAGYAVQFVGGSCGGSFSGGSETYVTMPITQDCTVTATFYLIQDVIFRDGFDS